MLQLLPVTIPQSISSPTAFRCRPSLLRHALLPLTLIKSQHILLGVVLFLTNMLALATPALHDHASSHAVAVSVPSNKTPLIRSKPLARRATASSSVLASSNSSYSSSSASSASSSSTAVPPSSSRPSLSSSQPHPSHETHSANRSEASSSRSSQQRLPVENLQSKQPNTAVALTETLASQPPATPAPVDINAYPTSDLLKVLASLLTQIATANDGLSSAMPNGAPESHTPPSGVRPPIWKTLFSASRISLSTPTSPLTFHARNIPSISLEAYLFRILRYCPTTNEVFLSLLVYFDRMSKLAQEASGKRFMIDSYNVHRLVIAGVTVASKFFSDVFYTNSRYAKVSYLFQCLAKPPRAGGFVISRAMHTHGAGETSRGLDLSRLSQPSKLSVLTPFPGRRSPASRTKSIGAPILAPQ